jgi:hypothetical protein
MWTNQEIKTNQDMGAHIYTVISISMDEPGDLKIVSSARPFAESSTGVKQTLAS